MQILGLPARLVAFLLLALSQCPLDVAVADDQQSERGRLPDGRAYRTDLEGNQLVDYIAELELEKEGLEGRIFKLQDQVRDAQFRSTGNHECPPVNLQACPPVTCPRIDASYSSSMRDGTANRSHEEKLHQLAKENVELDTEKSNLIEQLGSCQINTERANTRSASLMESIADLKKALADRDASLVSTRIQVADLRKERDRLFAMQDVAESDNSRAGLKKFEVAKAEVNGMPGSALSVARGQLLARVGEIRSQVKIRDEQFAKLDQQGKSLQVSPSPLKTRSGFELKNADAAISGASNFRKLAGLSKEVSEIQRIVADDIELGRRLSKR